MQQLIFEFLYMRNFEIFVDAKLENFRFCHTFFWITTIIISYVSAYLINGYHIGCNLMTTVRVAHQLCEWLLCLIIQYQIIWWQIAESICKLNKEPEYCWHMLLGPVDPYSDRILIWSRGWKTQFRCHSVLLCVFELTQGNCYGSRVFDLHERAKGVRTHDWESPTYHLTLSSIRQPWRAGFPPCSWQGVVQFNLIYSSNRLNDAPDPWAVLRCPSLTRLPVWGPSPEPLPLPSLFDWKGSLADHPLWSGDPNVPELSACGSAGWGRLVLPHYPVDRRPSDWWALARTLTLCEKSCAWYSRLWCDTRVAKYLFGGKKWFRICSFFVSGNCHTANPHNA